MKAAKFLFQTEGSGDDELETGERKILGQLAKNLSRICISRQPTHPKKKKKKSHLASLQAVAGRLDFLSVYVNLSNG